MAQHPTAFAHLLAALERFVTAPLEIAIIGDAGADDTRALRRVVVSRLLPASVTLTGSASDVSPLLADRTSRDGGATAFVCEHYTCKLPVTTPAELDEQLDSVLANR